MNANVSAWLHDEKPFLCMASLVWSLLMEKITLKFWPERRRKGLNSKIMSCRTDLCSFLPKLLPGLACCGYHKKFSMKGAPFSSGCVSEIICSAEVPASCSCCWWQRYLRSLRWHILEKMLFSVLNWTSRIIAFSFWGFFGGFVLFRVFFSVVEHSYSSSFPLLSLCENSKMMNSTSRASNWFGTDVTLSALDNQ